MSASFRGRVIDAGGGEVRIYWDRDQLCDYPPIGAKVEFTVTSVPPLPDVTPYDVILPVLTGGHVTRPWDIADSLVQDLQAAGLLKEEDDES